MAEGESATYRADVSDLPAAERSDLNYQWYRGTSKSALEPVEGATGQVFTIDSVSPRDDGTFVRLVAESDGVARRSAPVALKMQAVPTDSGFRRCLAVVFPNGYTAADLENLPRLDCSNRGIESLDDLSLIGDNGPINLSSNLITDISPLASNTGSLARSEQLDLSDNLISNVEPLGNVNVDLSAAPASFIVLDGNRISDVSDLKLIGTPPDDSDRAAISIERQVVGAPGGPANTDIDVPEALSVSGVPVTLSRDGEPLTGSFLRYPEDGVKELKWNEPVGENTRGVVFGGTFEILVAGEGEVFLDLIFPTDTPKGGDAVTARAYGFDSGETVTLSSTGEDNFFRDQAKVSAPADAAGVVSVNFALPYLEGEQTVVATSESGSKAATFTFSLRNDEVVKMPDEDLRACVNAQIVEPADAITYRSRLSRVTTDFSCRNRGVDDLRGLEALPTPSIDLTGTSVASFSTLKSLNPATTSLKLTNNELDDLGKVKAPNLERLTLSQNQLADLSPLNDADLSDDIRVVAVGQSIRLPQRVVGKSSKASVVRGLDGQTAAPGYPAQATRNGSSVTWKASGDYRVDFNLRQAADEESDASENPQPPRVELTGTFAIRVVAATPPAITQPPSTAPAQQQSSTPPRVRSLAPPRLVERVERRAEDRKTAPRAVALGPEVALEETSPTPRTVTNPTVEKRDPVTSVAGWGLTATGWSLLGAALLAMALAVGVAALILGRGTRGQS